MATAAAAAVARARRDVQHHFFSLDAVRPDRAVDFDPPTRLQRRQFERMRDGGIIHDTGDGRYWLDVVAYDVDLRERHRRVKTALIILLIILAAMLLATSFGLLQ
jgi:hypothetical protein